MSRLPENTPRRLAGFLLTALIAWAMARPLLHALSLGQEEPLAVLYALTASLLISLLSLPRRGLAVAAPLVLAGLLILSAALWKESLPARAFAFLTSLSMGTPAADAARLYMDALLPFLLMALALYARLLMEGDPAFSLPLLTAPLMLVWYLHRGESVWPYAPAMLCLPLLYAYTAAAPEMPRQAPVGRARGLQAVAVALALTLLAFLLTPAFRQTYPPAERMADNIRRTVEDYFFFTDTRNMFTLSSQGYQPMGERGLGGRPRISLNPVLRVETEGRLYLRGTALDLYNGRTWFDSLSSERYGWLSGRFAALRAGLFDEGLPRDDRIPVKQAAVTMLDTMPSTLFIAQRPRALEPGEGMVPYFNASSELFITRDLREGDAYAFRYEPYVAGEPMTDALAGRLQGAAQPANLPEAYFRLPQHLLPDGQVATLARDIAGGETDPYRQALRLMNYLKTNYAYSLDVPDAPDDMDFAAHFLFETKAGYCTYFATAMTVMARSLGLPARYVEGFLARPDGAGSVTLSGREAHAWTEIHIAGLGWVTFDATAGAGDQTPDGGGEPPPGAQSPPPGSPEPSPSPSPSPEPSPQSAPSDPPSDAPQEPATPTPPPEGAPPPEQGGQPPQAPPTPPGSRFPFWWLLLLAALLAVLAWRVIASRPENREKRLRTPEARFALYWHAALETLAARGFGMNAAETPLEYAGRLADLEPRLPSIAKAQSALAYGRETPAEETAVTAREAYQSAWRRLSPVGRALLSLRRALRPLKDGCKKLAALAGKAAKRPRSG